GCFALADIIQVSSQPVTPSFGVTAATGAFASLSCESMYGHDAPSVEPPFLNKSIWSDATTQYFFNSGFCFLSSAIVASNCFWSSSYGSLIPSAGCVFER